MTVLSKEEMIHVLRRAGYRLTRQRLTIIESVTGRTDHPSVKQVYHEINGLEPDIGLSTVYNTLNTLDALGVLKEIEFEETDNRFDTNLEPHINLVCTECGEIQDYTVKLPVKTSKIVRDKGFTTSDYRLEYRGICQTCNTNKTADKKQSTSRSTH